MSDKYAADIDAGRTGKEADVMRKAKRTGKKEGLALARALRQRDELEQHAARVSKLAATTGKRLGLEPTKLGALVRGAGLHDIGKLMIPKVILKKRGALSDQDWEIMYRHTLFAERILRSTRSFDPLAPVVRSTHERFDGTGYPDGLAGTRIPFAARIIFACDAYDAMTSKRPYAEPRRPGEARVELRRCAGTQFDPEVVDVLCAVLESKTSAGRPTRGSDHALNANGHASAPGRGDRSPAPPYFEGLSPPT